jgi:hypothetical protein
VAALAVHGVYQFNLVGGRDGRLHGGADHASGGAAEPTVLLERLQADLDVLTPGDDATALVQEARATVDGAILEAQAHVAGATDQARGTVSMAVGATGALPAVPASYLPGMPVEASGVTTIVYRVPGFGSIGLDELDALQAEWEAVGSGLVPPEGLPEELAPVVSAYEEQASFIFNDALTGPVWVIVGSAGLPAQDTVQPLITGVPTAGDALQPDEEGALVALAHAQDLLGSGGQLLVVLNQHIDLVEAQQKDLVDVVGDAYLATDAAAATQKGKMLNLSQGQIDAILAKVGSLEAQLDGTVTAYSTSVAGAKEVADEILDEAVATHVQPLVPLAEEQMGLLRGKGDEIASRLPGIEAEMQMRTAATIRQLEQLRDETGLPIEGHVSQANALLQDALVQVRSEATAHTTMLEQEAASIHAKVVETVGTLESRVEQVRVQVDGTVATALEHAETARAYGMALIEAQTVAAVEGHMQAALDAVAKIDEMAAKHKQTIWSTALDMNSKAYEAADLVGTTAEAIYGSTTTFVVEDLDYIAKVADDYAKRGPADVEKKAQEWSDIHATLGGVKDLVELSGLTAATKAEAVTSVLDGARFGLLSLAP